MARKSHFLLDRTKLPALTRWLEARQWRKVQTKGPFEVARFVHQVEIPLILFGKMFRADVMTVQDKDVSLVRAFLRDTHKARPLVIDSPYREDYELVHAAAEGGA